MSKILVENYLEEIYLKEDMGKAMGFIDNIIHGVGETNIAQKVAGYLSNNKFIQGIYGSGYTKNAAAHDVSQVAMVGGAFAAGLLTYAAYKTYKNYMSKEAKECRGKTSIDKQKCMKAVRQNAIKAQIKDLTASASGCSKSKDPAMCKAKISDKIDKLKLKI